MKKAQIGMVGLAVMGENLAMNMESHGFTVAVYDVRPGVVEHFMQGRGAGKGFIGAHSWQELADSLQPPRKVMLMIRAGEPVIRSSRSCCPSWRRGIPSSTAATATSPIPSAAPNMSKARACTTWAPAYRAARRGRCMAPA